MYMSLVALRSAEEKPNFNTAIACHDKNDCPLFTSGWKWRSSLTLKNENKQKNIDFILQAAAPSAKLPAARSRCQPSLSRQIASVSYTVAPTSCVGAHGSSTAVFGVFLGALRL